MVRKFWKLGLAFFLVIILAGGIYRYLHPAQSLSLVRILYPKGKAISEYYVLHSFRLLGETIRENSELGVKAFKPGFLGIKEEVYGKNFPYRIRYENLPGKWENKELIFSVNPSGEYVFENESGEKLTGSLGRYQRVKPGGILIEKDAWPELSGSDPFTVILQSPAEAAKSWRKQRRITFGNNQSRQVKLGFTDRFPDRSEKMLRGFVDVYARNQQQRAQDSLLRNLETVDWLMTQSDAQLQERGGIPHFVYPDNAYRNKQEEAVILVNQKEERLATLKKKRKILGRMEGVFLNDGLDQEWAELADTPADSQLSVILNEWRTLALDSTQGNQMGESEFQSLRKKRDVAIRRREIDLEAETEALRNEVAVAQNWLLDLSASEAVLWDFTQPGERLKALAWKKYTEQVREKIRIEEKLSHYSPNFNLVYESGSEPFQPASVYVQNFILILFGGYFLIILSILLVQWARPKYSLPEELRYRTGFSIAGQMPPLPEGKPYLDQLKAFLEIKHLEYPAVLVLCGDPGEKSQSGNKEEGTGTRSHLTRELASAFERSGVRCTIADLNELETAPPDLDQLKENHQLVLLNTLPPEADPRTWQLIHTADIALYVYQKGKTSAKNMVPFSKKAKDLGWDHIEILYVDEPT